MAKSISVYYIDFGSYIETQPILAKDKIAILATDTMYRYIPTDYIQIYTVCVGTVCKIILVHQLVLYCCLPDAASCLRPFRDSRGVCPRRF